MKKLMIFKLILLIILSTGVVVGAADIDNPDYKAGYNAGLSAGQKNFGSNISAYDALESYLSSGDGKYNNNTNFKNGFYEGYIDGLKGESPKLAYSEVLGTTLGNIYGTRDYQDGRKSNWEKALPNDRTLRRMFDLDMETASYRDTFMTEFKAKFYEAYLLAYEKAMLEPIRTSMQQGIKDGEELGKLLGATFGSKDYYEKRGIDFNRNLPTDREIIADYSLNGDTSEYKDGFLSGFKRGYEEEYNKVFREANKNETIRDEKDAYNHGKEVGNKIGETTATQDYLEQRTNDWKRSIPNDRTIVSDYNLTLQSSNYRDGFVAGFYDGYSEGYNAKFKDFSQGGAVNKTNSQLIPISGGALNSLDNAFNLSIEAGTYYHPVNVTIETSYNYNISLIPSSFIKASDSYAVSILNTSQNLDDKKLIELEFEYYGDKAKGGIYKFVKDKWVYLPSTIEDGFITTLVKPSNIAGLYSVFVDTNVGIFADARGHWAKDEINAFIRRSIISGYSDNTFKPDRNISRAEFLTILSRTYDWNMYYYYGNATPFKDYNSFGGNSNIINYATSMGYISGYPDGTFKPNNPISYREVEIIMSRIAYGMDSRWSTYATKMQYEKKVKSASLVNMNNKITRAEVVYMLYNINQGIN